MIYLTPNGIKNSVGMRFWKATDACCDFLKAGQDDSSYVRSLIDELSSILRIDQNRIYAVGFSNGGFLAHKIACDHSEKIAALSLLLVFSIIPLRNAIPRNLSIFFKFMAPMMKSSSLTVVKLWVLNTHPLLRLYKCGHRLINAKLIPFWRATHLTLKIPYMEWKLSLSLPRTVQKTETSHFGWLTMADTSLILWTAP